MSEKKEFKPLDVGATERLPWELAQGLREYFHIDKDGNITINPIHTYDIASGTKFEILFETPSPDGFTSGFGYIYSAEDEALYPGMFTYQLTNGKLTSFRGMDNFSIYSWDEGGELNITSISTADTTEPKLYMHQITLSNADGQSKRFQYITPYQVEANNISELTRLLGGRDVYLDTVQILHKTGNDWRVTGGTGDFVVSAVSDIMTPLDN